MNNDNDNSAVVLKMVVAWFGAVFGSISLSDAVLAATLAYTLLQTYILLRNLWKGV